MILGIGSDLVDQRRIERLMEDFGGRFLDRVFTSGEQIAAARLLFPRSRAAFYARRFAAKEACSKALGTGFRGGMTLSEIEIVSDGSGKPEIFLHGKAMENLYKRMFSGSGFQIHLTMTDEPPYAQAFVVIEVLP